MKNKDKLHFYVRGECTQERKVGYYKKAVHFLTKVKTKRVYRSRDCVGVYWDLHDVVILEEGDWL